MDVDLEELRSRGEQLRTVTTRAREIGWRQADLEWVVRRSFGALAVELLTNLENLVGWVERCAATVFGYGADVGTAVMLHRSLTVQAASGMRVASVDVPSAPGRKAAFRRAYLLGFARTIGRRLRASHDASVADAVGEHGDGVLPVLASRKVAVDAAVKALGKINSMTARVSDGDGWVAGAEAAERATLIGQPAVPLGPRAIGR